MTAEPRYLWFTNGPALIVGDDADERAPLVRVRVHGRRAASGSAAEIDAGPVEIEFTNATDERYALMIISLPGDYEVTMLPFLSGAELLSNQTFVDLFADETIVAGEGLAVRRLALLFTDLQGVDGALRPDRRPEGVRPRAAALRLPAGMHRRATRARS